MDIEPLKSNLDFIDVLQTLSTPPPQRNVLVFKEDPAAVFPVKAHQDDIGFDLTIIKHVKEISPCLHMYDTGIVVNPPPGFYIEIVPRSSFGKSGYILANSIGIIDPQYRGTLKVVLLRVDSSLEPLQLPLKGFQLVVRKAEQCQLIEVDSPFGNTDRGNGGFGSTGK
jgi:dUTP pyrophosphatase